MTSNGDLWPGGGSGAAFRTGTTRSATLGNTPERCATPASVLERSVTLGRQRNKSGPKRVTFKLESDASPPDVSGSTTELADGMPAWWPRPAGPGQSQTSQQTTGNTSSSAVALSTPSSGYGQNTAERALSPQMLLGHDDKDVSAQNTLGLSLSVGSYANSNSTPRTAKNQLLNSASRTSGKPLGGGAYSEAIINKNVDGATTSQPIGGQQNVSVPTWWPKSATSLDNSKSTDPEYYDNTRSDWQTENNAQDAFRSHQQPPNAVTSGHIDIEFKDVRHGSESPGSPLVQQRQQRASSVDITEYRGLRETLLSPPRNQRASLSPQLSRNAMLTSGRSRTIQSLPVILRKSAQTSQQASFNPALQRLPTDGTTAVFSIPVRSSNTTPPKKGHEGTLPAILKPKESDSTHPTEEDFWHRSPQSPRRMASSYQSETRSSSDVTTLSPRSARSDLTLKGKPRQLRQPQEEHELTRQQWESIDSWKNENHGSPYPPPPLPQRNYQMYSPSLQKIKNDFQPQHQQRQLDLLQHPHQPLSPAQPQEYQRQQNTRDHLEEHAQQQLRGQLMQQRLRTAWNSLASVPSKGNTTGDGASVQASTSQRIASCDLARGVDDDIKRNLTNIFRGSESDRRESMQTLTDHQPMRSSGHGTLQSSSSMMSKNDQQGNENGRVATHFRESNTNSRSVTPLPSLVVQCQKPALPPRTYLLADSSSRKSNPGLLSPSGLRRTFQESFQSPPPRSETSSPSLCSADASTITPTPSDSGLPSPSVSDSARWSVSEKGTLPDTKEGDSGRGSPHPLDDELEICLKSVEEAMASLQDSVKKHDVKQQAEAAIAKQNINRNFEVSPVGAGVDWRRRSYDGENLEHINRTRMWKNNSQDENRNTKREEEQGKLVSASPFAGLNPLQHNVRHLWTAGENNSANWTRLVVGDWLLGSENNAHEVVSRQIALWEGQPQDQGLLQGQRSICSGSNRGYSSGCREDSPGRGYSQAEDRRVSNQESENDPDEVGSQISRIGMESRQKHRSITEKTVPTYASASGYSTPRQMSLPSAVSPYSEPSGSPSPPHSRRAQTPSSWQPDASTSHLQNRISPARQQSEGNREILHSNQKQQHLQHRQQQLQQQQQQPYRYENTQQQNHQQQHQYEQLYSQQHQYEQQQQQKQYEYQKQQQRPQWQPNGSLPWQQAASPVSATPPWQPDTTSLTSAETSFDSRCGSGFGPQPHATQHPEGYNTSTPSAGLIPAAPVSPCGRQMAAGSGRRAAPLSPSGSVVSVDWNQLFETGSDRSSVMDDQLSCSSEVAQLSRPDVIRWYHQTQLPRGVGVDALTGRAAPWFHGVIGRPEAELRLLPCPPGAYLVRCSLRIWGYTLSYRCKNRCKHFLVEAGQYGYRFYGNPERHFRTLDELLRHHTIQPITTQGAELLRFPCTNHTNTTASQLVV